MIEIAHQICSFLERNRKSAQQNTTTDVVRDSWLLLEDKDVLELGVKFFVRIFDIAPPDFFKSKEALRKQLDNPGIQQHALRTFRQVGCAFAGVSEIETLVPVLEALGRRHGMKPEHFVIIGQAFLWTVEQGLGDQWTDEVRVAWEGTYDNVKAKIEPILAEHTASKQSSTSQ